MYNRTPQFIQSLFSKIIWKHSNSEPLITFDDGPDSLYTKKYLELLNLHEIKAVFFLLGRNCNDSKLIQEISDSGHLIGWHTQNHQSFYRLNQNQIISELESRKRIEDIISKPIQYFRFPYGHFLPWQIKHVFKQQMAPIMWSYMVQDYKPFEFNKRISLLNKIKPYDILLYHDISPNVHDAFNALKHSIESAQISYANKINIAFSNDLKQVY